MLILRTCLHKHMRTSFRQILPQTALKILAGRQPACGFLPCLQQNYARKSAHISYEDRFLFWLNKMKDSDILNEENRERIIDTFINSIYVYDDKVVINYNCREDSDTILPDNLGESSYLKIVGEPISKSEFCYEFGLFVIYKYQDYTSHEKAVPDTVK